MLVQMVMGMVYSPKPEPIAIPQNVTYTEGTVLPTKNLQNTVFAGSNLHMKAYILERQWSDTNLKPREEELVWEIDDLTYLERAENIR